MSILSQTANELAVTSSGHGSSLSGSGDSNTQSSSVTDKSTTNKSAIPTTEKSDPIQSSSSGSTEEVTSDSTSKEEGLALHSSDGYKIILLGDSAVGKSKLVERFLMGDFEPYQLSTYALTLFNYVTDVNGKPVKIVFWDTAGQERFQSMHPSYYHRASCCILVFDVTRKKTYKHLTKWYTELRENCPNIPCICVANKIDIDHRVTSKAFKFPKQHNIPLMYVSAADGTNVAKLFNEGIRLAVENDNKDTDDFMDQIMELISEPNFGKGPPPLTPSLAEQALTTKSDTTSSVSENASAQSEQG